MADLITADWRIRRGTYAETEMTSTYNVIALPIQSDQRKKWFRPIDPSGGWSRNAEIVEAFDGTRRGYGGIELSWTFTMLTPKMVDYLWFHLFDEQYSNTFTITTWDRGFGWRVINCTGLWNDPARDADQPGGWEGYDRLRIDFVDGTIAAANVGFTLGFSLGFDA